MTRPFFDTVFWWFCLIFPATYVNWQASSSEAIRIEVAVLDQYLVEDARKLKALFPDWVDVIAYSSFLSSYVF